MRTSVSDFSSWETGISIYKRSLGNSFMGWMWGCCGDFRSCPIDGIFTATVSTIYVFFFVWVNRIFNCIYSQKCGLESKDTRVMVTIRICMPAIAFNSFAKYPSRFERKRGFQRLSFVYRRIYRCCNHDASGYQRVDDVAGARAVFRGATCRFQF